MSKVNLALRLLLGVIFVVFGLNFFLKFIPYPQMSPEAGSFLGAIGATGYLFQLIKITEITVGILLLANIAVPLALVVLAPISLNILLFHLVLDHPGIPLSVVIVAIQIYLAYANKSKFSSLFEKSN